jgi:hypothetical protein
MLLTYRNGRVDRVSRFTPTGRVVNVLDTKDMRVGFDESETYLVTYKKDAPIADIARLLYRIFRQPINLEIMGEHLADSTDQSPLVKLAAAAAKAEIPLAEYITAEWTRINDT